ncbi:hypothetical protein ACFQ9X_16425 [Catenulispora yoronensis]
MLQDLDGQFLVLLGQLPGPGRDRRLVQHDRLDPQRRTGTGGTDTDGGAMGTAHDRDHTAGPGHPTGLLDDADDAGLGVAAVQARHQQHLGLAPRVGPFAAASTAARVSESDKSSGTTMPGRTTASSSGMTGKALVAPVMFSLICCGSLREVS